MWVAKKFIKHCRFPWQTHSLLPADLPSSWGICALDTPNVSCDFVTQCTKYIVVLQTCWMLIIRGGSQPSWYLSLLRATSSLTKHKRTLIILSVIGHIECYIESELAHYFFLQVQSSFFLATNRKWKQQLSDAYTNEAADIGGRDAYSTERQRWINRFGFKSKTEKRQTYTDTPTCERTSVMGSHFPNLLWWIQAMIFI